MSAPYYVGDPYAGAPVTVENDRFFWTGNLPVFVMVRRSLTDDDIRTFLTANVTIGFNYHKHAMSVLVQMAQSSWVWSVICREEDCPIVLERNEPEVLYLVLVDGTTNTVESVRAVPFSEEQQHRFAMCAMCLTGDQNSSINQAFLRNAKVMTKSEVENVLNKVDIEEYIPSGFRWTFRCHRLDPEPWPA